MSHIKKHSNPDSLALEPIFITSILCCQLSDNQTSKSGIIACGATLPATSLLPLHSPMVDRSKAGGKTSIASPQLDFFASLSPLIWQLYSSFSLVISQKENKKKKKSRHCLNLLKFFISSSYFFSTAPFPPFFPICFLSVFTNHL